MLESAHLYEWLHLLLRWIHFIVGVAWIGASFYFNWLENRLDRSAQEDGIAGDLWAIHGGGFYHLKKYAAGPAELPPALHWFKWEAYTTWLSGAALLVVVYYLNAALFMLDAGAKLQPWQAVAAGVAAVLGSWLVYDALCKSKLRDSPALLAACIFGALAALAWALSEALSGRAAYLHIGAAIGTMMAGNVFFVIIPAQKEMVAALRQRRAVNPALGAAALLRSRHNNYLTLPVLFIMMSAHFPATYGHQWNWAVLAVIAAAGVLARHYFNIRHLRRRGAAWLLAVGFALLAAAAWLTAPKLPAPMENSAAPDFARIVAIVQSRCANCHAESPTQAGFAAPPAGLALESPAAIAQNAARIFAATVTTRTMPIGNSTGMSEAERDMIAAWYTALETNSSPGKKP